MAPHRFPILFITASRIGDAVLSSGLIRSLAEEIPGARFTIVASELTAPLFAEVPGLDRVIVMEKRPLGRHWLDLWCETRERKWGLVVDTRGSAIATFLRPRRRAVHKAGGTPVHKVIEAARLLKLEDTPPAPFIFVDPASDARAETLTAGEGPILAMAPAANWVGKTWPVERFNQVARDLLGPGGALQGGRLLVVGGPEDREAALGMRGAATRGQLIDIAGRESLLVTFAALRRARLFIGGDSGLTHMAAAAGAPTLALFGPSDERLYAPWGPLGRTVRGPRSFEEIRAQDPHLNQALRHMMDLKVDTVLAAARALIAETEVAPPEDAADDEDE
jgi:ADP-heptose:LPS heptosyltransferase